MSLGETRLGRFASFLRLSISPPHSLFSPRVFVPSPSSPLSPHKLPYLLRPPSVHHAPRRHAGPARDAAAAAGRRASDEAGPAPSRTSRYEAPLSPERASEDLSRALGGATEKDAPVVARPTGKKPVQSEADYTSRLLKAKRRAKEDMDN